MKDALACARARVDDRSIAALRKPFLIRQAGGDTQQMAERSLIPLTGFVKRFYVFARNDQNMGGRLRVDVAESQRAIILVDDVRGNLPGNDSTKETIHKNSDR